MILEYIREDPFHEYGRCDELISEFAKYIVKVIGSEAYESNIRYSVYAMINTEKRPKINLLEFIRNISQRYEKHLTEEYMNMFMARIK